MTEINKAIILNTGQQTALDAMLAGENVFLTGEGGTGKSVVIEEFARITNKVVIECAPTGIAAIHIGGITVHKLLKPPFGPIASYMQPAKENDLMMAADVIVVDEISMLRFDLFMYMYRTIKLYEEIRNCRIQLIVVGDMFQLPPVVNNKSDGPALREIFGEIGKGFPFLTREWELCAFHSVVLTEPMRQSDGGFIKNLNKLRVGDKTCIDYFNRYTAEAPNNGITLCPSNSLAKAINENRMAKLDGEERQYKAIIEGEYDQDIMPAPNTLNIKVGARVMTLRNDKANRYQNGTCGTVIKLYSDAILIKFDNSNKALVGYETWQNIEYQVDENGEVQQKEIGSFSQIPVQLAYAITIHKSQGQTYDKINVDPRCFAEGQLYVACSRVKTIEGLYINREIKPPDIKVSEVVSDFYKKILN